MWSSALMKLYVDEADSDRSLELLSADPVPVTSWLSLVEVRRNLAGLLSGTPLARAREACERDPAPSARTAPHRDPCGVP